MTKTGNERDGGTPPVGARRGAGALSRERRFIRSIERGAEPSAAPAAVRERRRAGRAAALGLAIGLFALAPASGRACDVCSIYVATEMRESQTGPYLGVSEQFTRFGTLRDGGDRIANPNDEYLNSSVTQVVLGYNLLPTVGLQLNLPVISRTFRRLEAEGVANDDETGFGDMSLLARWRFYSAVTETGVLRLSALLGVKLPTGDSSRLAEELSEDEEEEQPSGVHGHDLALGSGSTDVILGGQGFWSWRRLYANGSLQYAVRTEGDFGYQYANDLVWRIGAGGFPLLGHGYTLGLEASFAGETRGKDTLRGVKADDTALTALYLGPGLSFTWGRRLGMRLYGDLPVLQNNSAIQIVADWRIRGGFVWTF